jgi:hypothetical protein
VIATFEDYAIVRELVVDLVSEGVEASVPVTVREAVEMVAGSTEPLSIVALAQLLKLDKSSASRRWQAARARGYLKNLENAKGKPAQIVLGDPLPAELELLPSVDRVREHCATAPSREEQAEAPYGDLVDQHNGRPLIGDEMYPSLLAQAVRHGHLTDDEAVQQYAVHKLAAAAGGQAE